MKFKSVIGNPPYQGSNRNWQIYPFFYLDSRELSGSYSCLIFPSGWQKYVRANNLSLMNTSEVKEDRQIVCIYNNKDIFSVSGAENTNVLLWKKDYDNGLNGGQIIIDGDKTQIIKLIQGIDDFERTKPKEIYNLAEKVKKTDGFISMSTDEYVSSRKPYGYDTFVFLYPQEYGIKELHTTKVAGTDIKIYGKLHKARYISRSTKIPKLSKCFDKYKVMIPHAWGNLDERKWWGGVYSDIIIGCPYEICTENYIENGCFDDYDTARKHAKYLMTQFVRALLYADKIDHNCSREVWKAVPIQTYEEEWWNESIENIDNQLFEKYNIEKEISDVIKQKIQPRTEKNIVNYYENEESEI